MRLRKRVLVWAIPAVCGAFGALAQSDVSKAPLLEEGRSLYGQQCARCHGFDMVNEGGQALDLRTFPRRDWERFFNSVTKGKGSNMPPWGDVLAVGQIEALWIYVQSAEKQR